MSPNILSELDWRKVRLLSLEAGVRWPLGRGFALGLRGAGGFVFDGRNRDSDWLEDDRHNEFSRSYSDVRGRAALDVSFELSWRLLGAGRDGSYIAPLAGYAWHELDLNMRNGVQAIQPVIVDQRIVGGTPVNYAFASLDSSYDAAWHGPYVGLEGRLAWDGGWRIAARYERHHSRYRAEADWNLREDFSHPISFRHQGNGAGWRGDLELAWRCTDRLDLTLTLSGSRFGLREGRARYFFSDGSKGITRLNEVGWRSVGASLGVRYVW
jgi:hypothetical protein